MARKQRCACCACGKKNLPRNDIGLNKKLLGEEVAQDMCLECLAAYLEVTADELRDKIEEFKSEGCKLFA